MNDQTTTAPANGETAAPALPSLDDLNRARITATNPDAETLVGKAIAIAEAHGLPVAYNWPAESEVMPDGYDVAIVPLTKRTETGNVPTALWIAAIPSLETVQGHAKGADYIRDVVGTALMAKLANSVRVKRDNGPLSVPLSVDDFIIAASRDQGLGAFREHVKDWVQGLKNAGLVGMNATLLRQVLSSASFASQQFTRIPQSKWVALLDKMIAKARGAGLDPGIMEVWKQTRDETTLGADDFDPEALDKI